MESVPFFPIYLDLCFIELTMKFSRKFSHKRLNNSQFLVYISLHCPYNRWFVFRYERNCYFKWNRKMFFFSFSNENFLNCVTTTYSYVPFLFKIFSNNLFSTKERLFRSPIILNPFSIIPSEHKGNRWKHRTEYD